MHRNLLRQALGFRGEKPNFALSFSEVPSQLDRMPIVARVHGFRIAILTGSPTMSDESRHPEPGDAEAQPGPATLRAAWLAASHATPPNLREWLSESIRQSPEAVLAFVRIDVEERVRRVLDSSVSHYVGVLGGVDAGTPLAQFLVHEELRCAFARGDAAIADASERLRPEFPAEVETSLAELRQISEGPTIARGVRDSGDAPTVSIRVPSPDRGDALASGRESDSRAESETRAYRKGESIGPYTLLARLGRGGFGEVWMAERANPTMRVALKLTRADRVDHDSLARFEAERQALALLDHPNIAKIHDAGYTDEGLPYFAMEYVRGEKITDYSDRLELTIGQRLALFAKVCDAVHHAHTQGLIHRDLSPDNILVSIDSRSEGEPKIIDFGIAKAVNPSLILTERTLAVELNMIIGKLEYMSPEQAEAHHLEVDTRTDIFALGVILYELMTGVLPLPGEQLRRRALADLLSAVRSGARPEPSTNFRALDEQTQVTKATARGLKDAGDLVRQLTGRARHLPMTAMRHDRAKRFSSAAAMARDIRNFIEERPFVEAAAEKWLEKLVLSVRRNPLPYGAAALIALSLVVGVVGTSIGMRQARLAEAAERAAKEDVQKEAAWSATMVSFMRDVFDSMRPGTPVDREHILNLADELMPRKVEEKPEHAVELHRTLGVVFRGLNDLETAQRQFTDAVRLAEQYPGSGDIDELKRYLAGALIGQAREMSALDAAGGEPQTVEQKAALATERAGIYHNFGDYELAEMYHRDALRLLKAANADGEAIGSQMTLLARLLVDAGFLDEALVMAADAVALRDTALKGAPDRGKRMAFAYLTLGYAQHASGLIDQAFASYENAVREYRDHHESRAPAVITAEAELRGLLEDLGRTPSDGTDFVPGISVPDLGTWSHWAAISLRNRGRILFRSGDIEKGNDRFERAVRIGEWLIAEHPEGDGLPAHLAHTYRVWGEMLLEAGILEDARAKCQQARRIQTDVLADSVVAMTPTLSAIASIDALDDPFAAEQGWRSGYTLRQDHLDDAAWPVATAAVRLAEFLAAMGKREEAADLAKRAAEMLESQESLESAHAQRAVIALDLLDLD